MSAGRPGVRWVRIPAALALCALVVPAAAAQEVRYTRPVVVQGTAPAGSWVRVPLGPEVLRHAGAGGGLRLFGPEGEDVVFRRIADPEPDDERPARSYRVSYPRLDCREREPGAASARVACRLPLGGAGRFLRRLCFTAVSERPAGYRLFLAEEGRWETVAEGVWRGTGEETLRCLPLDLTLADAEDTLRLELYGGAEEAPAIRDATAELRGESLLFRARRPGRHTLAYGPGVTRGSRFDRLPAPAGVEAVTVEAGPEEAAEVPAGELDLSAAAAPAPTVSFGQTWSVAADDPEPGALHRLALPAEAYGAAGEDLSGLRLVVMDLTSEVQVPYLRWRPEEPVLAAERRGAAAEPREEGPARVGLEAAEARLPLSALVVSAPAGRGGWNRRVRAVWLGTDEAGDGVRAASSWLEWPCAAAPPLPCRLSVALADAGSAGGRRLAVEIDDRGAGPLPAVDLELWRRRDALLFGWPAGDGRLVLGAGADGLAAPEYELEARRQELLARPWREARLVAEEAAAAAGGRLGAWAIGLTLVAAAAALVVLLHRILGEQHRA